MIEAFVWATPKELVGKCKDCWEWDGPMWGRCAGCHYRQQGNDLVEFLSVWDRDIPGRRRKNERSQAKQSDWMAVPLAED